MAAGDKRQWNRTCQLVAWAVMTIIARIPRFKGKGGTDSFPMRLSVNWMMKNMAPPGFDSELYNSDMKTIKRLSMGPPNG